MLIKDTFMGNMRENLSIYG